MTTEPNSPLPPPRDAEAEGIETLRLQEAIANRLFGGDEAQPVAVGRFTIEAPLGGGAMGHVYLAHDPALERQVAVKVLRRELGPDAQRRMLREGRALAQLDHPNVVPVYDVGTVGDQVFVAMAYAPGRTLRAWIDAHPCRTRADVTRTIELFVQAGRGLAHAHRNGLVHRDFKPDNVLVSDEGLVRVVDFGLAAAEGVPPGSSDRPIDRTRASSSGGFDRLTAEGEIVGTPVYMAPEQLLGLPTDPRSDQYSFCVALFEALHGQRPYKASNLDELRAQILLGAPLQRPDGTSVPRFVERALRKGLSRVPEDRFPSMDGLLVALTADPRRAARRWVGFGLVGAAMLVVAGLAYSTGLSRTPVVDPCAGAELGLQGVWDETRREAVTQALRGPGANFAEATVRSVGTTLDAYAERWSTMHRDNCEATRVRAEQSEELFDRREACFVDRRRAVAALVDVLLQADRAVVERAVEAAEGLPDLSACAWSESYTSPVPQPRDPEVARGVDRVRDRIAISVALRSAGRYVDAKAHITEVEQTERELSFEPLQAELTFERAVIGLELGKHDEAADGFERTFWTALATSHDRLLAAAAVARADLAAEREAPEEVTEWGQRARAALRRIGGDARLGWNLEASLGEFEHRRSNLDEALRHERRALELLRSIEDPPRLDEGGIINAIGATLMRKGDSKGAVESYREALAILDEAVGPNHPAVAAVHNNLAIASLEAGAPDEARRHLQAALTIYDAVYPEGEVETANALSVLGGVERDSGDFEAAERAIARASDLFRRILGPDHPRFASSLRSMASLRIPQCRYDEARVLLEEALSIARKMDPPDRAHIASMLVYQGSIALKTGDPKTARARYTEAVASMRAQLGADTPWVAHELQGVARSHAALGEHRRALEALDEAIALRVGQYGAGDARIAPVFVTRGDVLRRANAWAQAVEAYDQALELFENAGDTNEIAIAEALLGRALAAARLGRLDLVRGDLERARTLSDRLTGYAELRRDIHRALAERYTADGRLEEARAAAAQADGAGACGTAKRSR